MARKQVWILVTLLLGVFMGALDIFIVAPALSAIQAGLHISPRLITWSFTAYTLVLVVTQPFTATLSDRYGRRWVYIACVALFGLGSTLCATAPGFGLFILGRCVQAIGAGGVIPVASAVIADVFPLEKRGAALGIQGSVFGLAFILGPVIGSALTQGAHLGAATTDWRAIFVVNLPLAAFIILLAARWLPTRAHARRTLTFDWNGALLLACALFCIVFGLTQLDFSNLSANFTNEAAAPLLLLGACLLIPFWLHERHALAPIIDTRIFSRRQLQIAMTLSLIGGIVTSSIVYVPQLIENALGLVSGAGGVYLICVALTLTLGTPVVGRFIDKRGSRAVIRSGALVGVLAFILLILARTAIPGIVSALLLMGGGLATFYGAPLRYIVVNEAAPQRRASSLAVLTICSSLGQTIVLPLGGALIASAIAGLPANHHAAATVNAIHNYYGVIAALLVGAAILTLGLKSQAQEVFANAPQQHTVISPHSNPMNDAAAYKEPAMTAH